MDEMKRLLIADASPVFADELTRRLGGTFQIMSCADGITAQTMLDTFQPHVLVIDLMLPYMDGLSLIEHAASGASRPAILATTRFMTPFVEQTLHRIDIDYLMYRPCDFGVMTDRICEISGTQRGDIFMPIVPGNAVTDMLTALNVSVNHKGFHYLRCGIELFSRTPNISMTKSLYPEIGRQFNVRADAVERDIRLAVCAAWNSQDPHIWRLYFGSDVHGTVPRPTNTTFISTLAARLQQQIRQAL